MSKQYQLTAKQLTAIKADDAKTATSAAKAIVKSTADVYGKLSHRLHVTACVAAFMASRHGDTSAINTMFTWLKKNDKLALKNWMVENTTFTHEPEEEDKPSVEMNWIVVNTDNGDPVVKVKANTKKINFHSVRVELTLEDWLALPNFSEKDNVGDEALKGYDLFEVIRKEINKADKIAAGDSDKFEWTENDNAHMLARILHHAYNGDLSKLYAAVSSGQDPANDKLEIETI